MTEGLLNLADEIASKSPVAVAGTKMNLIYSRDHSIKEGLEYVLTWNSAMLQTKARLKDQFSFLGFTPSHEEEKDL